MKRQFLYILLLMVGCIVQAQMPQLLPMPQKVSFTGKYVRAGVPVREVLVPDRGFTGDGRQWASWL